MKKEDVRQNQIERKNIPVNVRTYPSYSKWMKDNKISPTSLFNKAIEELAGKELKKYKEEVKETKQPKKPFRSEHKKPSRKKHR